MISVILCRYFPCLAVWLAFSAAAISTICSPYQHMLVLLDVPAPFQLILSIIQVRKQMLAPLTFSGLVLS